MELTEGLNAGVGGVPNLDVDVDLDLDVGVDENG